MKSILRQVCWVVAAVSCSLLGAAESRAEPPTAIFTNQPGFRIPYRFDRAEMQRLRAKEIRLFLSRNGGLEWQHVQTVAPEAGRFDFKAQVDGEYWFAVRTVDGSNQLHPDANVVEPGLVVVVDRTAPDLQLLLQPAEAGKVQLSWSVSDANFDPAKLTLEFSQAGGNWQPVSIKAQATGQTSWTVPNGGQVSVRGSATDRAGNVGTAQTSVAVQAGGLGGPMRKRPDAADYNQPIAGNSSAPMPEPVSNFPFGPAGNSSVAPPPPPSDPFSAFTSPSGRSATPAPTQFPGETKSATSFPTSAATAQGQGRVNTAEWGSNRSRFASNGRFRAVKSHRFEVNYRIDDVGPSGVSSVELFVTQNNGQKWFKYGDDADKQSPFVVEVPEDGIYGFAIRVRSGAGLADDPPQTGEEPSVVIVVDRTPPQVQLLPVQQGAGGQMNKITIGWRMADDNPSDKPISLAYSANPNGPWERICDWQPDTGNYVWNVGQGVPSRFYVRLAARDAAGNHAYVDTPQPLLVDLAKPTARIVDVEANGPQ